MTIKLKNKLYSLDIPIVMGVLNFTPDSFYSNSRYSIDMELVPKIEKMLLDGAAIIDIGAYSSRPGAIHISEEEEIKRLSEPLAIIRKHFPDIIISIDTFRSNVVDKLITNYEINLVNDISAGHLDENMIPTIAKHGIPYIMMHMPDNPQNMQNNFVEGDLMQKLTLYFSERVDKAHFAGISDIIIDPGFGFGKSLEQNFVILDKLHQLKLLDKPILVGMSRKSMIYKTLNCTPDDAMNGTSVLNTIALLKGASILRVHDVKEAVECINLVQKLNP